jgi:hypothetical protein
VKVFRVKLEGRECDMAILKYEIIDTRSRHLVGIVVNENDLCSFVFSLVLT